MPKISEENIIKCRHRYKLYNIAECFGNCLPTGQPMQHMSSEKGDVSGHFRS